MALTPGKTYVNSLIRLTCNFQDNTETDVDPPTIVFKTMSPSGTETSYTYGTATEITKDSVGDYSADIVPDESGRWFFRWESSGAGTTYDLALEGSFLVQYSPFYDGVPKAYSL